MKQKYESKSESNETDEDVKKLMLILNKSKSEAQELLDKANGDKFSNEYGFKI